MEEAVDESESLVSLSILNPDARVDERIQVEEGGGRDPSEEDVEKGEEGGEGEAAEEDREEADGSGGSLIDHLISRLPIPVPGEMSPDADEASLLISIARD